MTGPPAATAAVRLAVRRSLARLPGPVAAAVSGGADSLALAAALGFERPGSFALVVDHQLQDGSAEVAHRAAEQCRSLGLTAEVLRAKVASGTLADPQHQGAVDRPESGAAAGSLPDPQHQGAVDRPESGAAAREIRRLARGPEAVARELRYRLLDEAADRRDVGAVLLGHTRDDQAETVLLGLARGAGARALSGMAAARGRYLRPLLGLPRAATRQACAQAGLTPWEDPHNTDPAYARVRARRVLPALEAALGPGIAEALARTARQLREDADALDALAEPTDDLRRLEQLVPAIRARSLKRWAEQQAGRPVTSAHVEALRALVEDWHGQGAVGLPGGSTVVREAGHLVHRTQG